MFKLGICSKDMMTPDGLYLCGYIGRESTATGIHDPLIIRAAAINRFNNTLLIISCDLIGISTDFSKSVSNRISKETGIPIPNIVICCTHTHSGPNTIKMFGMGDIDCGFLRDLCEDMVYCAVKAFHDMKAMKLYFHHGSSNISINRVLNQMWGGKDTENWETYDWDGEKNEKMRPVSELFDAGLDVSNFTDSELLILKANDMHGKTCALFINYACHPVTLEYTNYYYSKDFICYLSQKLKGHYPEAEIFFLNGCCGDINPIIRGGYDVAQQIGENLADDVIKYLDSDEEEVTGEICIKQTIFPVTVNSELNIDQLNIRIERYQKTLEQVKPNDSKTVTKVLKAYIEWTQNAISQLKNNTAFDKIDADIRLIKIGGFNIATIPFEVFHEIGVNIKCKLNPGKTMVVAYANGENGYLISERLYQFAKYERFEAFKFTEYLGPIGINASSLIVSKFLEMEY